MCKILYLFNFFSQYQKKMILTILLIIYFVLILGILLIFVTITPRISPKNDNNNTTNKTAYFYIGFYILNSIILNYIFSLHPFKTVLTNLVLLVVAHIIGLKLRVMGLTGQICSGKSTVGKYLEQKYKACVIDIDKLNREVLEMPEVKKEIRLSFGDEVFKEEEVDNTGNTINNTNNTKNSSTLDKLKMRSIIFSDPEKRKKLEKITHKRVFKLLALKILKEKIFYNTKYVFIENAILLRFTMLYYMCYPILSVCTNSNAEILGRVMERDKCDRKTAENILANQMKLEEFVKKSDYVIFNDEGLEELKTEVDKFMAKIY
jgi:dephospho-CoA kinase